MIYIPRSPLGHRFVASAVALAASLALGAAWAGNESGSNTNYGFNSGTGGSLNSFFGSNSGTSTTASRNAFVGRYSGYTNTTGDANTFMGYASGYRNTTGSENVYLGRGAGYNASTGSYNAIVGFEAGINNGASSDNAFLGAQAGYSNTSGSANTFAGRSSGYSNSTGQNNSFLGHQAAYNNTTGSNNTFIGRSAGYNTTSGGLNVALGAQAGLGNQTGSRNTFIGSKTRSLGIVSNASAVGHRAQVRRSDAMVLGSVAGVNGAARSADVGIGTDAPTAALHVRRSLSGTSELVQLENDSSTVANRPMIQMTNKGGTAINFTHTGVARTWIVQANRNGLDRVEINRAGLGGTEFVLTSAGNLTITGTLTQNSNVHDKTGIVAVDGADVLARVQALPISTWRYKADAEVPHLGPMAQDFYAAFRLGADETKIAPGDMAGVALAAIKAQQAQIESQQAQLQAQQATIDALRTEMQGLSHVLKARLDALGRDAVPALKVSLSRP